MSGHLTDEQVEAPGDSPHLASCAQCQKAVARAAARRKLLGGVKPYTLADVAFSRVEAKLMEHVRDNPPGPRWSFGRIFAIAALAAIVMMFAVSTVRPLLGNKAEIPIAAFEPMTVIHASGGVAAKAGDVLNKDASLDAEKGQVVLATSDGMALRLAGGARFVLGANDATVRLASGTLTVDGHSRGPWVVANATHWVKVVDATFDIAADQLRLYRGSVVLADNAAFDNPRHVIAPAVFRFGDGATLSLGGAKSGLRDTPPPPWAKLELALAASEVELDGQRVGSSPLSLMTTPGKHHLRALVGEAWRDGDIELGAGSTGGAIDFPEKQNIVPPAAVPTGPVVEADPEAIAAAVKSQLPKLRVCHEKWLKVNESARGKVLMSVTVSPKGRVTKAAFTADEGVPATVNECLGRAVRAMTLPKSSEEVELEIPVLLGAQ